MTPRKISLGKIGDRRRARKAESKEREKSGRAAGALSVPEDVGTAREMADPKRARGPAKQSKKQTTAKRPPASSGEPKKSAKPKPGKGVVETLDTSGGVRARRLVVPDDVRAGYGLVREP